jgi:hypothetical protein
MAENVDNGLGNVQENSEKSENIQQNSEINTENENNSPSEDINPPSEGEKAPSSEGDSDELELPEPDIIEDDANKKKKEPEWIKKRIERERVAAERKEAEAARLREENERLRMGIQQPNAPQAPQNPQAGFDPYMPQREQFKTDADFFLALGDYREARRNEAVVFHQRQEAIKKHETEFQGKLKEAIDSGATKYKDFAERTDYILYGEGFPSNRAMAEAIVESEYKDDILYFLGTHVKEAERIANLNPVKAAMEIEKLANRFTSKRKSNITKAPAPLKPLSGGSQGSGSHKDPNNMEMDEFRQWYKDKFG